MDVVDVNHNRCVVVLPKKLELVGNIRLFGSLYTTCHLTEDGIILSEEYIYKAIGVRPDDWYEVILADEDKVRPLKYRAPALFLQPFIKCLFSRVYRDNVLNYLSKLSGNPRSGVLFLELILEPPDKEILDYAWNHRVMTLVWTRIEIENAFSWLSTLGGAYSALGDYFEHCAEEAGRISERQYKLSKMLGDDGLAARSKLYSALSYAQKGKLKLSRHIVRHVYNFGKATKDRRLVRMCQGVWAKLKYLRGLKGKVACGDGNGVV